MLSRALDMHDKMKQPKDKQWMHNVLSYLRNFVGCQGCDMLVHDIDKTDHISRLVSCLVDAAHNLESGRSVELLASCGSIYCFVETVSLEHHILSPVIAPDTELAETQDGAYVNLNVSNELPCVCHSEILRDNSTR